MSDSKENFLASTRKAREERLQDRRRLQAATVIQSWIRGTIERRRLRKSINDGFGAHFGTESCTSKSNIPALKAFFCIRSYLFLTPDARVGDSQRFQIICRYIVSSIVTSSQLETNYVSVALQPSCAVAWLRQINKLLVNTSRQLNSLRPDHDSQTIGLYLNFILVLTSVDSWRLLIDKKHVHLRPVLTKLAATLLTMAFSADLYSAFHSILYTSVVNGRCVMTANQLIAVVTLADRHLSSCQYSPSAAQQFLQHVLSAPLLVTSLNSASEKAFELLHGATLFAAVVAFLGDEENCSTLLERIQSGLFLCLLGNLVQLAHMSLIGASTACTSSEFPRCLIQILHRIRRLSSERGTKVSQWHSVLGWLHCQPPIPDCLLEALPGVRSQLRLLWKPEMQQFLYKAIGFNSVSSKAADVHHSVSATSNSKSALSSRVPTKRTTALLSLLRRGTTRRSVLQLSEATKCQWLAAASLCRLHQMSFKALNQMHTDILTSLCFSSPFLPDLWSLIAQLGDDCGLELFLSLLPSEIAQFNTSDQLVVLSVFCDFMANYVILLDDEEMYTDQKMFTLIDYVRLSTLTNLLIYRIISNSSLQADELAGNELFRSVLSLLRVLYSRDCRRSFTLDGHWLIDELRQSCIHDVSKNKNSVTMLLRSVPHVFAHDERVMLLRQEVNREKVALGAVATPFSQLQSTLITVHRSRLLEDGYRQLSNLPGNLLKGCVRVKFINKQGLDEAGIDQDGVFKEFLEETIKLVFDPGLCLFRSTVENELYPSPSSNVHDNHLELFEFVGKMLAKAIYEGIVVDVPFAQFFLSELTGHSNQRLYCSIDELPSLDAELYKNITFIKKYTGDVQDLGLTFSYDEDILGEVITHDLIPGGRIVPVTNENKISYVYSLAHFRMRTQIKDQTAAFLRGFRSLIRHEWIMLFSPSEMQKLISGDNGEVNVRELRRYTQYYGGFHDKHRVINWFWDVLENEFNANEKKMFLKFVTACSKPPLMGFAHLRPPFSIRCTEVSDDEDRGDTLGSMLRGFFSVHRRQQVTRLPTASTCFNMLKLPHYDRKSTLRDKLRYSMANNTGFELS